MSPQLTRRTILGSTLPIGAAALLGLPARAAGAPDLASPHQAFPRQDPQRVYDTVLYAHTDAERVRKLVEASPALANATMDWGFGDWESAIGSASHMGRRDIAEILLDNGARPDLFTHAMLGNLGAVRAIVEAMPGVQRIPGPHGITILAHAKAGKSQLMVEYLESLGDADPAQTSSPLEVEKEAYLGVYSFGTGPDERFEIVDRRDFLGLRRGDGFARTLFHLGNHEFHPTGARGVRVRFELDGQRAVKVRVYDPDLLVEARRVVAAGS